MKKRFRKLSMLVILVMSVAGFSGCAASTSNSAKSGGSGTIRIGQTVALTGERTTIGEYLSAGAKMAVDEINKSGGINGKKVELIQEDSASDNQSMVNAYNKLLNSNVVAILCNDVSTQNFAISALSNKSKMPTFVGGTNPNLLNGNDWFFRFRPSDEIAAQAAVKYAIQTLGKKKIAIAHLTDDFGKAGGALLKKYVEQFGGTIATEQSFNFGEKDMAAQLTNIKNSGAEVIIDWADTTTGATMMKQNKELGINLPFIGSAAHGTPTTIKLAGDAANGVYVVMDGQITQLTDAKSQDWVKKFKELYNKNPEFNSTGTYDAIYLLKKAIENANGATDNESIRKGIFAIRDYSGMANTFSYLDNGNGPSQVVICQTQNGAPVLKETIKRGN